MSESIKILIGYHKPSYLFRGSMFVPIHAGRAVSRVISKDGCVNDEDAQWLLDNTIGDNTGDNISHKNREYCECTALYWAWKNYEKLGNPDYIGFMQYARQFNLSNFNFGKKEFNVREQAYKYILLKYPCLNQDTYLSQLGLTYSNITDIFKEFDGIVTSEADLSIMNCKSQREEYEKVNSGLNVDDFDIMHEVIKEKYPEMSDCIEKRKNEPRKSCFQMYILRREVFFDYMQFLFSVLFECEKRIDVSSYSINGKRTMGYLAEFLCDYYVNYNKHKYKFKFCDVVRYETIRDQSFFSCKKFIKKFFSYAFYQTIYAFYQNSYLKEQKNNSRNFVKFFIKAKKSTVISL